MGRKKVSKKEINNYDQYQSARLAIKYRIPRGPFTNIQIDEFGNLELGDQYLQAEEAFRVAKYLYDFYGCMEKANE